MTVQIDARTGNGGLRRRHTPPVLTNDDARAVQKHIAEGRTLKWCAQAYKVERKTVGRALKRLTKPLAPTLPDPESNGYTKTQMLTYGRQCRDYALQLEELKK